MNYTYDELLSVIYNELLPVYQKHNPGVTFDELITKAKKAKLPALCRTNEIKIYLHERDELNV